MLLVHFFRAAAAAIRSEALEPTQSGSNGDVYDFDEAGNSIPGLSGVQLPESRLRMLSTLVSRAFQERRVEQLAIPEVYHPYPLYSRHILSIHNLGLWLRVSRNAIQNDTLGVIP